MKILTSSEMKEVDRLTPERGGIPSLMLMENAGKSVADFIRRRFPKFVRQRVLVLCGKGNNGGDGLVVARCLREAGAAPDVCLFADPSEMRGDAAVNCRRWQEASGELSVVRDANDWPRVQELLSKADIIVDALLGTGTRGPVEGLLRVAIEAVNQAKTMGRAVVAIDIPSGLNADTGEVGSVAITADYTVTFTAPKPGLFLCLAYRHVGDLQLREIGSPASLIEEVGAGAMRWSEPAEFTRFGARRKPTGNKGDYGHALIVAGSVGKSGAAVLSSWAALRAGPGLVTVATPQPVLLTVAAHTPEIMTEGLAATEAGGIALRSLEAGRFASLAKGKGVIAIGPGLTTQSETQEFVRKVVLETSETPIVLDADGLNAFAGRAEELKYARIPLALTPHPGEMARLAECSTADIQRSRVETAGKYAKQWNCHLVLKGYQTITAAPDGRIWINSTGNPGMGTGGTGDVLTGMLAGLTAQFKADAWPEMLAFGVYLHGLAGDLAAADVGEAPLMASDLIRLTPQAYQQFYSEIDRG